MHFVGLAWLSVTESVNIPESTTRDLIRTKCSTFLNETQQYLLWEKLNCIGVQSEKDLKFVEMADLLDINILSLIQARKAYLVFTSRPTDKTSLQANTGIDPTTSTEKDIHVSLPVSEMNSPTPQPPPPPNSPCSSISSGTESSEITKLAADWSSYYEIPWNKFPKSFMKSCEGNQSPSQSDRRETVRILVEDMMQKCTKPSARDVYMIASKLVDTYRTSLLDKFGDALIGSGYSSFINRIQDRINNVHRKKADTSTPSKKRIHQYGCKPQSAPINEENAVEVQQRLQKLAEMSDIDYSMVYDLMDKSYGLQRAEIDNSTPILILHKNWPFLFDKTCSLKHFERLTGVNLTKEFYINSSHKKKTLIMYMENLSKTRSDVKDVFTEIDEFKSVTDSSYPETQRLIKLITRYFKEEYFEYFPIATDRKQIELKARTEGAPIIAVVGNFYSHTIYHLVVEGKSVQVFDKLDDAVLVQFAVYYILNLRYLKKATSTLEFLQRVFFGINPVRGSKAKKYSRSPVNYQVLNLISDLRSFELEELAKDEV